MKRKILLLIVGTAVVGGSITVVVFEKKARQEEQARTQEAAGAQSPIGTAISNYNQTFKLNTNPPLWREEKKK